MVHAQLLAFQGDKWSESHTLRGGTESSTYTLKKRYRVQIWRDMCLLKDVKALQRLKEEKKETLGPPE